MTSVYHRHLPEFSTLLCGRVPRDDFGFQSDRLQIWYNNTSEGWTDTAPHLHKDSDECFIVLSGTLVVDIDGDQFTVGPREYCFFPRGVYHAVINVTPPVETLMIRAPSIDDKVYRKA